MVDAPVSKTGEGKLHAGSIPALGIINSASVSVAQWIARPPPKGQVGGSNPPRDAMLIKWLNAEGGQVSP